MIRKIIWLIILIATGYIGYQIWHNLNDQERAAIKTKAGEVFDKTTGGLQDVADKLTETTKESIDKHLIKQKETLSAEEKPSPSANTPSTVRPHGGKKP